MVDRLRKIRPEISADYLRRQAGSVRILATPNGVFIFTTFTIGLITKRAIRNIWRLFLMLE